MPCMERVSASVPVYPGVGRSVDLATLMGFCDLNILRMMLVLGLLGLITSLPDPQLCQ